MASWIAMNTPSPVCKLGLEPSVYILTAFFDLVWEVVPVCECWYKNLVLFFKVYSGRDEVCCVWN